MRDNKYNIHHKVGSKLSFGGSQRFFERRSMRPVTFYEVFREEEKALKKFLPGIRANHLTSKTIQESKHLLPPSGIICVRTQSQIPLNWKNKLEGILTRSQGFDHLTVYRRACGFPGACGYLGDYCSRAVAEHAVMTMFVLLKKLKKQMKNFHSFSRDNLTGLECQNRKALIIGVGHIGAQIADMLIGLRMSVKGVDLVKRLKRFSYTSLNQGIRWADIVFCSLPSTPQTAGFLNYNTLKKAKAGLIFINVGRGEVAPHRDLYRLLEENTLGGVGLDVYEKENEVAGDLRAGRNPKGLAGQIIQRLKEWDNVVLTPHNAFNTYESVQRKAQLTATSINYFMKHRKFPFPV